MITIRCSEQDETKFWLAEMHKQKERGVFYTPLSIPEGKGILYRRTARKLYGVSKYKLSGETYTKKERPWLFD